MPSSILNIVVARNVSEHEVVVMNTCGPLRVGVTIACGSQHTDHCIASRQVVTSTRPTAPGQSVCLTASSITLSRDELGHIIESAVEMALAKFGVRADEWEPAVLPIFDDIDFKDNKKPGENIKDDLDDEFVPVFEVKTVLNAVPKLPRTVKDLNEWSRAIVISGKQMKKQGLSRGVAPRRVREVAHGAPFADPGPVPEELGGVCLGGEKQQLHRPRREGGAR